MELIKNMLLRIFGVKENPVVEFFFANADAVKNGTQKIPEGYRLYKTKDFFGVDWSCYIRKCVSGCFSDAYWKVTE